MTAGLVVPIRRVAQEVLLRLMGTCHSESGSPMVKVLVVDDEQPIVDLLVEIVTDAGHSALTARNGLDALRLAQQHQPALIISDVMMPFMDGYALLQALRADPALAHTMVILISAAAAQSQRTSSATAFLRKPLDLEALDTFLRNLPV